MFVYNSETHRYDSDSISVELCYDDLYEGICDYQDSEHFVRSRLRMAELLEKSYLENLDKIVDYMISEGLVDFYGDFTEEELTKEVIKEKLGKPVIDIGREVVSYRNNKFKPFHIIEFEYHSVLDKYFHFTIDG
jgi:hypothetical protein